jgi:hypothetical protein
LGVSLDEIDPTQNALVDIVRRLDEAGAGAEQFAGAMTEAFGERGAPAIQALLSQVDVLGELVLAMREASGRAREMADIQANTLIGAFRSFQSAVSELILQLGDSGLLAVMRDVVLFAADIARVWAGMTDELTNDLGTVSAAAEGLKIALIAVGSAAVIGALRTALLAVRALTAAMIRNPITALAVGVTAAAAYIIENWDEVREFIEDTWDAIRAGAIFLWEGLGALFENLTAYIADLFREMASTVLGVLADVLSAANDVAAVVANSNVGVGAGTLLDALGGDRGSLLAVGASVTGDEDLMRSAVEAGFDIGRSQGLEGIAQAEESLRSLAGELATGGGVSTVRGRGFGEILAELHAPREAERFAGTPLR